MAAPSAIRLLVGRSPCIRQRSWSSLPYVGPSSGFFGQKPPAVRVLQGSAGFTTASIADTTEAKYPAYWHAISHWSDVSAKDFLDHDWQISNIVQGERQLRDFLGRVVPETLAHDVTTPPELQHIKTRDDFIADVMEGIRAAPMSIRLTPHILSLVDWSRVLTDPLRKQFIPLKSSLKPDHPKLSLDSLHEMKDSPVPGLVHRYPNKALFLATSVCPVYCRFCTRSYAVGAQTATVSKVPSPPARRRWEKVFRYIEDTPALNDIVVSGGDAYYLQHEHLLEIGMRLLSIPHIRRFRIATKGLAVSPMKILSDHEWMDALTKITNDARSMGKTIALHTHFNHPREITWVTELAARKLFERGITVRNQTVLLKGVNDELDTMKMLILKLADTNIQPYYVYQGDMVKGVEDLRTKLSTILSLERHIRGTIAGFMTPNFVVDLPGGGGKRLACSYDSYDEKAGIATYSAPCISGIQNFTYYDPLP